ncbi:MAG: hypothetical protein LBK52_04905, partial [Deltaproteobacteria bacterium]|nr:hypothetical protein [Deltaproteobacteria bacterium]
DSRRYCRSLNRTIDLGFLSGGDRLAGLAEPKTAEFVEVLARRWNLTPAALIRLIKSAYDWDQTVYLTDLAGPDSPLILLRPYFPQMSRILRRSGCKELAAACLLPEIDDLPKSTAEFWDRLFMDFYLRAADLEEAVLGLAGHLIRRRGQLQPVEFGGRLGPAGEVEKMPYEKICPILSEFIMTQWPGLPSARRKSSPGGILARRLAADLHSAGRIFGLPWTFLTVLVRQSRSQGLAWPSTLDIYSGSLEVFQQVHIFSRRWAGGKLPLCDLDLLAARGRAGKMEELARLKGELINYVVRSMQKADTLFSPDIG